MKKYLSLTIITCIAFTSLYVSAGSFSEQLAEFQQSNLCIKEKIAAGVARDQIEIVNGKCFIK